MDERGSAMAVVTETNAHPTGHMTYTQRKCFWVQNIGELKIDEFELAGSNCVPSHSASGKLLFFLLSLYWRVTRKTKMRQSVFIIVTFRHLPRSGILLILLFDKSSSSSAGRPFKACKQQKTIWSSNWLSNNKNYM